MEYASAEIKSSMKREALKISFSLYTSLLAFLSL